MVIYHIDMVIYHIDMVILEIGMGYLVTLAAHRTVRAHSVPLHIYPLLLIQTVRG